VIVQSIPLQNLQWDMPDVEGDDGSDSEKHSLTTAAFTGVLAKDHDNDKRSEGKSNFTVRLIPIVSDVIGVLNSGTILTPQTLEVIIEIYAFPYLNVNNSLKFTFAIVTSTNGSLNETLIVNNIHRFVSGGKNRDAVYFDITPIVLYENISETVIMNIQVGNLSALTNSHLIPQVQSLPNHTVIVTIVEVFFSPGKLNISYDPAQGIGSGPSPVRASLSSLSIILGSVFGAVIFLLLVAIFLNYCFKAKKQKDILETIGLLDKERGMRSDENTRY